MRKNRYRYNPETLSYDKVKTRPMIVILKVFGFLSAAAVFALLIIQASFNFLDSPNEAKLKRELSQQEYHIQHLENKVDELTENLTDLEKRDEEIYREIFGAPLPDALRSAGVGGTKRYPELKGLSHEKSLVHMNQQLDQLSRKAAIQDKSYNELIKLAKQKSKMLASIPAIQPVANKDLKRMASGYGYRIDPFYRTRKFHAGMDFTSPTGTEIHATGDGVVEKVVAMRWGYGKHVIINHGYGYKTLYAHMSKFNVKPGQKVVRGQTIGFVGSTGKSTAPHLHYEVMVNGQKLNPANYYYNDLSAEEYERLIELSSHPNQAFD
ncbi:MAG: M23 family metallopeptidase [Flavobacteriales bacterium]|nr:M23 family metallopeptidase [Bacteroidota bacterium]MCB9240282.1 M23 family metallopeptidase [Flavobacteriales bacterium]